METRTAALAAHASHTPDANKKRAVSTSSPVTSCLRLKPSSKACAGNARVKTVASMSQTVHEPLRHWKNAGQMSGHG